MCTHQLRSIIQTTQNENHLKDLNSVARAVAEQRVLQIKLSELLVEDGLGKEALRLQCKFVCDIMQLAQAIRQE